MASEPALATLETLAPEEIEALTSAAAWYVQYHGKMIAERADDRSLMASARREEFLRLHGALWKLGVRLRLPDGL